MYLKILEWIYHGKSEKKNKSFLLSIDIQPFENNIKRGIGLPSKKSVMRLYNIKYMINLFCTFKIILIIN